MPPINVSIHSSVEAKRSQDDSYHPENYRSLVNDEIATVTSLAEQRERVRQKAKVKAARIEMNGQTTSCDLINFSAMGGAMIKTDKTLEVDTPVMLSSDYFAKTSGHVVWSDANTAGIRFAS